MFSDASGGFTEGVWGFQPFFREGKKIRKLEHEKEAGKIENGRFLYFIVVTPFSLDMILDPPLSFTLR